MSRIFITGDTHIPIDIKKLSTKNWEEQKNLTGDDYLIIAGDFGLLWDAVETREEKYWTKWLNNKKFTTLFIDGNHENFTRLNRLEKTSFLGGKVGVVSNSIFYLRRGEIYSINKKKFLTIGGSHSHDIEHRREGVSWWKEEEINEDEKKHTIKNLEKHNYEVDYIVAHTLPESLTRYLGYRDDFYPDPCKVRVFLDEVVLKTKFDDFYCGHFHEDKDFKKYHILYDRIVEIK